MSFVDFWTNENNPALSKSEYLYNFRHIMVLIIAILACVVLTIIFFKKSDKAKNILFRVLASILLFFEILSRIVNLIIEPSLTLTSVAKIILPMHICSVMVWIFIIAIFSKNKLLLNFATIGGLFATVIFLLYPAVGLNRVYMSFTCIYSTFSHMLGFITSVLLITLNQVEFNFKKIWQPFLCFAIMFIWGVLLNWVIFPGSDYMYLRNDPLELNLGFPYHILYGIILALYITLFYIISFFIKKIKTKNKNRKII